MLFVPLKNYKNLEEMTVDELTGSLEAHEQRRKMKEGRSRGSHRFNRGRGHGQEEKESEDEGQSNQQNWRGYGRGRSMEHSNNEELINEFKGDRTREFEMTDLGLMSYFLGLENVDIDEMHQDDDNDGGWDVWTSAENENVKDDKFEEDITKMEEKIILHTIITDL
ncbi:hypothetical protein AgCh_008231 [Apium graveolens]